MTVLNTKAKVLEMMARTSPYEVSRCEDCDLPIIKHEDEMAYFDYSRCSFCASEYVNNQ